MLSNQEIYDKVKAHLLAQNAKATVASHYGEVCKYRADDGKKCAVGALINDDIDTKPFEGVVVDYVDEPYPDESAAQLGKALRDSGVATTATTLRLLSALQNVHDYEEPEAWAEELKEVAIDFKLNP